MAQSILMRADADGQTGIGHLMRSVALAQAWRAAGGDATLFGRCPAKVIQNWIREAGIDFWPLERPHPDPADLTATLAMLRDVQSNDDSRWPVWLVLDGYHFTPEYQETFRQTDCRLLVIDDTAHLEHYNADSVLNQNLQAQQLDYPCDADTTLMLGGRFVLLRPEFRAQEAHSRQTPEVARKVLVTLGGADPANVTPRVIQALAGLDIAGLEARIVIGAANPHRGVVEEEIKRSSAAFQLVPHTFDMPSLMAWADVAVGAAGSTCWELAFMQVPAVVIVAADNQEVVAGPLADAGAIVNLGRSEQVSPEAIVASLDALCRDPARRAAQSEAGRRLIDGRGAERVVTVMRALDAPFPPGQPRLRPVAADDVLPLWRLANDPLVRRQSLSPDPISLDTHVAWFNEKLASEKTRIWVLDLDGLLVGTIRYDANNEQTALVSFSVAAPFRRRGLGARLLEQTWPLARDELDLVRLRAEVRQENVPSVRIFTQAGFEIVESGPVKGHACHVFERAT